MQLLDFLNYVDMESYSLKNRSLRSILDSGFYLDVENSWSCSTYSEGRIEICENFALKSVETSLDSTKGSRSFFYLWSFYR